MIRFLQTVFRKKYYWGCVLQFIAEHTGEDLENPCMRRSRLTSLPSTL